MGYESKQEKRRIRFKLKILCIIIANLLFLISFYLLTVERDKVGGELDAVYRDSLANSDQYTLFQLFRLSAVNAQNQYKLLSQFNSSEKEDIDKLKMEERNFLESADYYLYGYVYGEFPNETEMEQLVTSNATKLNFIYSQITVDGQIMQALNKTAEQKLFQKKKELDKAANDIIFEAVSLQIVGALLSLIVLIVEMFEKESDGDSKAELSETAPNSSHISRP